MALNFQRIRDLLSKFKFSDLFIEELGWSKPSRQKPETLKIDNKTYQYQKIAELSGVAIFEVTAADGNIPEAKVRVAIHQEVTKLIAENHFYGEFLKALFFESFAKPEIERDLSVQELVGKVKYLNGGLFLKHHIEDKYQISIVDEAFEQVLDLFGRYSWNLDDTPEGKDDEINPDVLGYIFEKYINQKAFGAYYTRPQITEYLCDRTIHKLIVDRVNDSLSDKDKSFEDINELLIKLDTNVCGLLMDDILPNLSILDPACGSGAFLVAAMKTLIQVYSAVFGTIKLMDDGILKTKLADIENSHPSLPYFIKKRIVSDNLYGIDIMEEATEIAKLRLFLALVSSANDVEELEPLPNIDFNIMAGNSLIGLIKVDDTAFDAVGNSLQGNLLQSLAADNYKKILEEKNKSVELYKEHAFSPKQLPDTDTPKDTRLIHIRKNIEQLNKKSQEKLNLLLLDEFSKRLGIKYEEVQLTGKSQKRVLKVEDIATLKPFHWGYHFNEVLERGGFDVIITNPPWEIFKPNAREFFLQHNDLVRKSKMDIKAFEKEQKQLLANPEIATTCLGYQSQFPHISAYYRSAEQYKNQISVVNGKKSGTDINLYKLFLEQSFNLLCKSGQCGILLPSGVYTDLGTKQLREMLFSQTNIDAIFGLSNERFIFEGVDHRFKFSLLTFEKDGITDSFTAAFRINPHEAIRVNQLETFLKNKDERVKISVPLIRGLSPDSLSVMEFKNEIDIHMAEKIAKFPLLGEKIEDKWNLRLTREFDMTNDSHLFKQQLIKGRLPLYEGKMIHQFTHLYAEPKYWVNEQEARKALLGRNETDKGQTLDYQSYRLGFRSVASSTNERSLISSIIPKSVFCGNSLLISLRYSENNQINMNNSEMLFSTAIFNSLVIDYCLRQKVTTNLNMFYVYQLPVPRLTKNDRNFNDIVQRAAKLICTTPEFDELAQEVGLGSYQQGVTDEAERAKLRAELDGMVAHLYGLTEDEFSYILTTFPIVNATVKEAALSAYRKFVPMFGNSELVSC
ncbi:Eco57I restriction-modification methylase domain-containing protein [Nostoc sp. LEGE 12450]|uniref:Eco57I restriction-modification methylase domain-containing protein n=1 Tax=Nostoc sp. LEGE 12450 TaxID=1828643 RepID=UPI00187F6946|nr:DNA methyltransferase [Nostoc sp. LEGE 12450]MBE8987509.1 ATP-binding protein [Nostoc sp. LEGE 12450]